MVCFVQSIVSVCTMRVDGLHTFRKTKASNNLAFGHTWQKPLLLLLRAKLLWIYVSAGPHNGLVGGCIPMPPMANELWTDIPLR